MELERGSAVVIGLRVGNKEHGEAIHTDEGFTLYGDGYIVGHKVDLDKLVEQVKEDREAMNPTVSIGAIPPA